MIKADFHIHSKFSHDSFSTIEQIVKSALSSGLNLIAVTDHDTVKGGLALVKYLKENPCGIVGISGVEKTVEGGTHLLCLGVHKEVKAKTLKKVISEVKSLGGVVGLAHPFRIDTGFFYNKKHKTCFSDDDVSFALKNVDFIELVNSKSFFENKEELLKLARDYQGLHFLASSDAHAYYEVANAFSVFQGFDVEKFDLKQLMKSSCKMFIYYREKKSLKKKSSWRVLTGKVLKFFYLRRFCNTAILYWQYLRKQSQNLEKNRKLKSQNKQVEVPIDEHQKIILLK